MFRRTLFPLGLLVLACGAFAAGAWSIADGNDLAGLYFVAVAVVALRAQARISTLGIA
ncbi:MAG TPA: hypothetical protein VGH28_12770 [Polyangiaceae bacterium]|jgi:hypothetical protein